MKKIIERIFKNLLGILNEDKRTKIIRANWHIETNKSRKDLRVKTFHINKEHKMTQSPSVYFMYFY